MTIHPCYESRYLYLHIDIYIPSKDGFPKLGTIILTTILAMNLYLYLQCISTYRFIAWMVVKIMDPNLTIHPCYESRYLYLHIDIYIPSKDGFPKLWTIILTTILAMNLYLYLQCISTYRFIAWMVPKKMDPNFDNHPCYESGSIYTMYIYIQIHSMDGCQNYGP